MEIVKKTHGKPWIEENCKIFYFVEPIGNGWCLYRDKPPKDEHKESFKEKKSFKEIIREVFKKCFRYTER